MLDRFPVTAVSSSVRGIDALVPTLEERGATLAPLSATGSSATTGARTLDVATLGVVESAFPRDSEGNVIALTELA